MKNLLTKSLLLIIINLFFTAASTQTLKTTEESYQYRHFSTKDGLPSNTIFNVLQDEHNLAWIGTDDGLARFDGNSFKVYKHNPYDSNSLSSNYITNLVKDSKNRLWVGTDYGVDMYDEVHDNFKIFIPKKGKAESSIAAKCSQIAEDDDHNIWIGTNDGLYIIDAD
ncbi:MAG: two-component regulator propeller domain-containing protein, partial [Parafilimonas sp.]